MAETKKAVAAGRQAPADVWTPGALKAAVSAGSNDDKVAMLKDLGILTPSGELSKKYRNWGTKVSRTADADE